MALFITIPLMLGQQYYYYCDYIVSNISNKICTMNFSCLAEKLLLKQEIGGIGTFMMVFVLHFHASKIIMAVKSIFFCVVHFVVMHLKLYFILVVTFYKLIRVFIFLLLFVVIFYIFFYTCICINKSL